MKTLTYSGLAIVAGTHARMLWANPSMSDSEKLIHAWLNLGAAVAIAWDISK